jgi:hypothetical protein
MRYGRLIAQNMVKPNADPGDRTVDLGTKCHNETLASLPICCAARKGGAAARERLALSVAMLMGPGRVSLLCNRAGLEAVRGVTTSATRLTATCWVDRLRGLRPTGWRAYTVSAHGHGAHSSAPSYRCAQQHIYTRTVAWRQQVCLVHNNSSPS